MSERVRVKYASNLYGIYTDTMATDGAPHEKNGDINTHKHVLGQCKDLWYETTLRMNTTMIMSESKRVLSVFCFSNVGLARYQTTETKSSEIITLSVFPMSLCDKTGNVTNQY